MDLIKSMIFCGWFVLISPIFGKIPVINISKDVYIDSRVNPSPSSG